MLNVCDVDSLFAVLSLRGRVVFFVCVEMQMNKWSSGRGCRGRSRTDSVMPTAEQHRGIENFNKAAYTVFTACQWLYFCL